MEKERAGFTDKVNDLPQQERGPVLKAHAWVKERTEFLPSGDHPARLSLSAGEDAASILIDLKLDVHAIIACILIPAADNAAELRRIEPLFGGEIAALLEGVIKSSRISGKSRTLLEAETIRNTLFVMNGDYRVLLILLAVKLALLGTQGTEDAEILKTHAQESLNVYAPLAARLGTSRIKDELEDLSLKILNREIYSQIKELVAAKRAERKEFLSRAETAIMEAAVKAGIAIEASSRAKHFYSIYLKMRRRNKSAAEIFDLFGVRIICETVEQCYTLLGIVHRLWKPIDGSFKDYIARPKPNGYMSLHTSVLAGSGASSTEEHTLEIQIRTREMHRVAEHGVASHWLYKRGLASELQGLKESLTHKSDDMAWYDEIRREITKKWVYVFTPQGKAVKLPAGATPVDFAYGIHSGIGEHCVGAKADGSIIPLHSGLKNTQTVEILTSPQAHPSVNWLESVKTSKARNKIRSWLEKHSDTAVNEKSANLRKTIIVKQPEILSKSAQLPSLELVQNPGAETMRVRIEDEKNMLVRFARCCHPVSGDPISGYVSRGRGIIIHRKNCLNLANIPDAAERLIEAEWENSSSVQVKRFRIEARFKANLFSEIEGVARKYQGRLIEGRLEENPGRRMTGFFTIRFERPGDLKMAHKKIRGIPGIISLETLG